MITHAHSLHYATLQQNKYWYIVCKELCFIHLPACEDLLNKIRRKAASNALISVILQHDSSQSGSQYNNWLSKFWWYHTTALLSAALTMLLSLCCCLDCVFFRCVVYSLIDGLRFSDGVHDLERFSKMTSTSDTDVASTTDFSIGPLPTS